MPTVTAKLSEDGLVLNALFTISLDLEKKLREEGKPIPKPISVRALIDTGASGSVVKSEIAEKLGLTPIGVVQIKTPLSKSEKGDECYQYSMRMGMPEHQLTYNGVFVASGLAGQNIGALIGRDMLQHGILIYLGKENQFTLSLL